MKWVLGIVAALALNACGSSKPVTPEDCEKQFAPEDFDLDGYADVQQLMPSYTYDIADVQAEELKKFIVVDDDEGPTTGTVTTGSNGRALEKFLAQEATKSGALFMSENGSYFRILGPSGTRAQTIRFGCSNGPKGGKLTAIAWKNTSNTEVAD
ncbi:MAG: hypothetical protein ABJ242_10210 [Marinomonas sp.]